MRNDLFRITFLSVVGYPFTPGPYEISCICPSGREDAASGGTSCRDPDGILLADEVLDGESYPLSCGHVGGTSVSSNWGTSPGPRLISVVASDPDDNDAVYSNGDMLTLVFDQPTDVGVGLLGVPLNRSQVGKHGKYSV